MELSPEDCRRCLVEIALRRSHVKRRIVMYLSIHGYGYVSGIARDIYATPTNVIGALRGMNNRYNVKDSLLSLEVVSEMTLRGDDRVKMFRLTSEVGKDAVVMCKKFDKGVA